MSSDQGCDELTYIALNDSESLPPLSPSVLLNESHLICGSSPILSPILFDFSDDPWNLNALDIPNENDMVYDNIQTVKTDLLNELNIIKDNLSQKIKDVHSVVTNVKRSIENVEFKDRSLKRKLDRVGWEDLDMSSKRNKSIVITSLDRIVKRYTIEGYDFTILSTLSRVLTTVYIESELSQMAQREYDNGLIFSVFFDVLSRTNLHLLNSDVVENLFNVLNEEDVQHMEKLLENHEYLDSAWWTRVVESYSYSPIIRLTPFEGNRTMTYKLYPAMDMYTGNCEDIIVPLNKVGSFTMQLHYLSCIWNRLQNRKKILGTWEITYSMLVALYGSKLSKMFNFKIIKYICINQQTCMRRCSFSGGVVRDSIRSILYNIVDSNSVRRVIDDDTSMYEGLLTVLNFMMKVICNDFTYKSKSSDWVAFFEQYENVGPFLTILEEFKDVGYLKDKKKGRLFDMDMSGLVYFRLMKQTSIISKLTPLQFKQYYIDEGVFEEVIDVRTNVATIKWMGCPKPSNTPISNIKDSYIMEKVREKVVMKTQLKNKS